MSRYPADPDFEPRVADWLEADPDIAPAPVLSTVLAAFPSIPQRRASRVPWRFPPMSTFAKLAVAAVAVIAVGTVGIIALQPSGGRTAGSARRHARRPRRTPRRHRRPLHLRRLRRRRRPWRDVHVAHERDHDRLPCRVAHAGGHGAVDDDRLALVRSVGG